MITLGPRNVGPVSPRRLPQLARRGRPSSTKRVYYMFTVEVGGRPIAIRNSPKDEAEEFFRGAVFRDDLLCLDGHDGLPLWDGAAKLFVRRAFEEEIASFEVTFAQALADQSVGRDDEEGYVAFLVHVTDSTDPD
jgi:hypothetical protein